MRPFAPTLVCLTLAACSPAVYVTPGASDVLPAEAQHFIDAATATAAQAATQAAQATATDQSARETATAASLGTLDAVAARQTEVARMAQQAAIAREAFRLLPPGHWAERAPGEGYQVYALPGLLDAPATVIQNTPTTPDRAHAWRQSVRLFAWWGDMYGFGVRELGPAGAGVVTDPGWRALTKLL